MRSRLLAFAALLVVLASGGTAHASLPAGEPTLGIDRLADGDPPLTVVRGIATYDAVPTALDVAALRSHGLTVQPLAHLPLALVRGTVQSME